MKRRSTRLERKLFGLGDYTAGDACWSRTGTVTRRVNDDRCAPVTEDRMVISAERYVGCDDRDFGRAVRANDQREIGDVTCRGRVRMIIVGT